MSPIPLTYPPQPPTLTGDQVSISRFLLSPELVYRRMAELAKNRFVGDRIFGMPAIPALGSLTYSPDLQPYLTKQIEAINPGAEYPRALLPTGSATVATVIKNGVDVALTDEAINRIGGYNMSVQSAASLIDNALMLIITTLKAAIDRLAMAAMDAAVTNTAATVVSWKTVATSDPVQDVTLARAKIRKGAADVYGTFPGSGYTADTIVCSDLNEAYLGSSAKIQAALSRVNDAYVQGDPNSGTLTLDGMVIKPTGMLPTPTKAYVVDSSQFGCYAYEQLTSPEYTGDAATGVETWARRDPDANDAWLIRGRRPVVPIVINPSAGFSITGLTE